MAGRRRSPNDNALDRGTVIIMRENHNDKNRDHQENTTDSLSSSAFTLIEVMIALVVLLLGVLGVMGMQYYAVAGNTSSREMRIATSLTQEKIEELELVSYTILDNGDDTPALMSEKSIYAGQTYVRRWWVFPDCVALDLPDDDNPCNAALAATCSQDPDGAATVATSAIRARTCWFDKNNNWRSVSMDSLRWNENVSP